MKNNYDRIIKEATYFYENYSTVREVAKIFNIGKTTVHKDLTEKLKTINIQLYNEVQKVIKYNKSVRHIRGGEATRKIYIEQKKINESF
jgi:putative DeoR family transcriptional regulator (stage III sporulation protein D)